MGVIIPMNDESRPFKSNTARNFDTDAVKKSLEISKILFSNIKPNFVILVNKHQIFDIIASASLARFPKNATILLTD